MRKTSPTSPNGRPADALARPKGGLRAGFTLIELLVVIVIIGILVALLIPVISGAVKAANNARVVAEINNLSTALEDFKSKYGDYPPSRVILSETMTPPAASTIVDFTGWIIGYGSNGAAITGRLPNAAAKRSLASDGTTTLDLSTTQLWSRSIQYMRKFWPRMASQQAIAANPSLWHDFNGNGVIDSGYYYLEGHEALAFFLGGVPSNVGGTYSMNGFAKAVDYPFKGVLSGGGAMSTENRNPPHFEFNSGRLVDEDADGIPGYLDPLQTGPEGRFLVYFSAYGNNGYDPNDANGLLSPVNMADIEVDDAGATVGRSFRVNLGLSADNIVLSPAPNPYTSTPPVTPSNGNVYSPTSYQRAQSFQIISAGGDRFYGPGGQYTASGTDRLPADAGATAAIRLREADNLTNFANGKIGD